MTQIITLFKKEYRQQGPLAAAMIFLCILMQFGGTLLFQVPLIYGSVTPAAPNPYAVALFVTALFAGAAAAASFSIEHEDKTFAFLRNLPVTPLTVMLGKTVWLAAATLAVLLCLFMTAGLLEMGAFADINTGISLQESWSLFGVAVIEAFVWGLFWSPRCRSQVSAVLITYFTASASSFFAAQWYMGTDISDAYCQAAPLRLGIAALVSVFTVRGMLQWFRTAAHRQNQINVTEKQNRLFSRHPKKIRSPFSALLHQSVRQSSALFLAGIILAPPIFFFFLTAVSPDTSADVLCDEVLRDYARANFFITPIVIGSALFYILYCGSIFAADQRNDSFRFLSRCGISARQIWFSRILTFSPVLLFGFAWLFAAFVFIVFILLREVLGLRASLAHPDIFYLYAGGLLSAAYLIPFSVGAFLSVSCRHPVVSVALTGAVSLLIVVWMCLLGGIFGFNPFWTTVPLCIAFLAASRIRTVYWLREERTFKSRLKPLIPVFVTMIAVLSAVPFVRIYSISYIPFERAEALLDRTTIAERLNPADRKALFQSVFARLSQPMTGDDVQDAGVYWFLNDVRSYLGARRTTVPHYALLPKLEQCKIDLQSYEKIVESQPLFEVWLLNNYEVKYRFINHPSFTVQERMNTPYCQTFARFLPWEKTRLLRRFNAKLAASILTLNSRGGNWYAHRSDDYVEYEMAELRSFQYRIFDMLPWEWGDGSNPGYFLHQIRFQRLMLVRLALECWYLEHNNTLPESLDELTGTYLKKIPTDPQTGAVMLYEPHFDRKVIEENRAKRNWHKREGLAHVGFGSGAKPHIQQDLDFLPEYEELTAR
ncbi:MAG: ABC transporter permease [Planctomycetaceae bacterium]|jgi:hypothetical protein|nr:ABC transporter permease [Planctomycetaceae bacterium]